MTAVIVFVWHEQRLADDRAATQRAAAAGFASHSSNTVTKQHHYPSFSVCQHWYKQAATARLPPPQNKQPTEYMNVSLRITQMVCNVLPGKTIDWIEKDIIDITRPSLTRVGCTVFILNVI